MIRESINHWNRNSRCNADRISDSSHSLTLNPPIRITLEMNLAIR